MAKNDGATQILINMMNAPLKTKHGKKQKKLFQFLSFTSTQVRCSSGECKRVTSTTFCLFYSSDLSKNL